MLSDNLKEIRNKSGQTQRELASKIGVTPYAVCCWETGRSLPTKENIQKLCDAFKISREELFADSDNMLREDWLIEQYDKLSENKKRIVDDFILLLGRRAL